MKMVMLVLILNWGKATGGEIHHVPVSSLSECKAAGETFMKMYDSRPHGSYMCIASDRIEVGKGYY